MLGVNNHGIKISRSQGGGGGRPGARGYGELELLRRTGVMLRRRGRGAWMRRTRRKSRLYHVTWKLDSRGVKVRRSRGRNRGDEQVTCEMKHHILSVA